MLETDLHNGAKVKPDKVIKWALYADHLDGYMSRWIERDPWGTTRLHHILTSDDGRDFHDHPFNFTSLILSGGYVEHVPGCTCAVDLYEHVRRMSACRYYGPGSIVRRRAEDFHRLELVNGPAWTLVRSSRYFREWGFLLPTGEWVQHDKYKAKFL